MHLLLIWWIDDVVVVVFAVGVGESLVVGGLVGTSGSSAGALVGEVAVVEVGPMGLGWPSCVLVVRGVGSRQFPSRWVLWGGRSVLSLHVWARRRNVMGIGVFPSGPGPEIHCLSSSLNRLWVWGGCWATVASFLEWRPVVCGGTFVSVAGVFGGSWWVQRGRTCGRPCWLRG